MDIGTLLLTSTQLLLTAGVGGVFLLNYATKDIFLSEETVEGKDSRFSSEYDELMWLAEKQKHKPSDEETLRFYELRSRWPEMHLSCPEAAYIQAVSA